MHRKGRIVLLKLGGSVITDKRRAFKANYRLIHRIARELAKRRERLVLLNGAGSFGHIPVKQFRLDAGFSEKKTSDFANTKLHLLRLQQILLSVLCSHGIPAVPFIPSSFMMARSGRLSTVMIGPILALLDMGLVPLLGGDLVADRDQGWRVISADQMASWIGPRIGASMIVYGTDVDGLYSSDPRTSNDARLIETVACRELRSIANSAAGSRMPDVTAGMRGKVAEAQKACGRGVEVVIMNLTKPELLHAILDGKPGKWTRIVPEGRVLE